MVLLLGPEQSDPIGGSGDLSSGAFDGLLVLQIQTVVCGQQENVTWNASCSASKLPFNLPISKLYTDDCGCFSISSRSGNEYIMISYHCDSNTILQAQFANSNVTVHYAQQWSLVSDDVVYV